MGVSTLIYMICLKSLQVLGFFFFIEVRAEKLYTVSEVMLSPLRPEQGVRAVCIK